MAEHCIDCWKKLHQSEPQKSPKHLILSKEPELCEGCGKYRPVVLMERRCYYRQKFRLLLLPVKVLKALWNLLTSPYRLYRIRKSGSRRN